MRTYSEKELKLAFIAGALHMTDEMMREAIGVVTVQTRIELREASFAKLIARLNS
jgi:hypothetical protein